MEFKHEMELYLPFQASGQKTSITKCSTFDPRSSNIILKPEKELTKQEMELFPQLQASDQINLLQNVFHLIQWV